jgi:hypothetical protein
MAGAHGRGRQQPGNHPGELVGFSPAAEDTGNDGT